MLFYFIISEEDVTLECSKMDKKCECLITFKCTGLYVQRGLFFILNDLLKKVIYVARSKKFAIFGR